MMKRITQSIKFKIVLAFSVCVVLMGAIGVYGIHGISKLNSNLGDSYSGNLVPVAELSAVRIAQIDLRLKLRHSQLVRDPIKVKTFIQSIHTDEARINTAWNHYYKEGIAGEKEREIADRIKGLFPQAKAIGDEAITALDAGDQEAAGAFIDKLDPIAESINDALEQDVELNLVQARQFADNSESTFRTILWISIVLVGTGVVVAMGMSIYLARAVSNPLAKAMHVANQVASGKLDNQVVVTSRDEFGQLLEALKAMDGQISHTVRRIRTSTESVTVASREIASGNTDLSARTEQQAASLEETAASMTQLTETVKQNADNAQQANTLATKATDMADAGNDAVQGMVETIGRISGSSTKISEITGVIEGIAFQTNILALNAAVEAARAGEQGRGFAVVASEVRSLAQRSATAAKEIKELIDSSVAMIQDGERQAGEVRMSMGDVKQAIKQVSDIVGEIAAASEEQRRGIEQVNQAVVQMDDVTQQNAALVEQAAAAAQSLEEQANSLTGAVSAFVLDDTGSPTSQMVGPKSRPRALPPSLPTRNAKRMSIEQTSGAATSTAATIADGKNQGWEAF